MRRGRGPQRALRAHADRGGFSARYLGQPDAPPAKSVSASELESNRIRGNRNIMPDDIEKRAIAAAHEDKIIASLKTCIDTDGKVALVRIVRSSGYPGYDRKIETEMRAWQYKPFLVDGKPTRVCTVTTFIYKQESLTASASRGGRRCSPRGRTSRGPCRSPSA